MEQEFEQIPQTNAALVPNVLENLSENRNNMGMFLFF